MNINECDFYHRMARHELCQARRYAMTDAQRSARAFRRCNLWRQKLKGLGTYKDNLNTYPARAAGPYQTEIN